MAGLAGDLAYLVMVVAGDLITSLLALVIVFTLVLAVRDGLARASS